MRVSMTTGGRLPSLSLVAGPYRRRVLGQAPVCMYPDTAPFAFIPRLISDDVSSGDRACAYHGHGHGHGHGQAIHLQL